MISRSELLCQKQIIDVLNKYELIDSFNDTGDLNIWISKLNKLQISNLLNLNIDPNAIKFEHKLLINLDLLNMTDYEKRVQALVSIENADGWYHLFDKMLNPYFLNSPKFYQDIETLKRAESAQYPLWIIGENDFIDSPYHDCDFELLVTAKDNSERKLDFVVSEVIATIAGNVDSIKSQYHKKDLETVVKYGSAVLQTMHTYPEYSIGYLAINKVSLNDRFHLENMEILANNPDIGNYLYPIMTNEETINKTYYRRIIEEMIEHKPYSFLFNSYKFLSTYAFHSRECVLRTATKQHIILSTKQITNNLVFWVIIPIKKTNPAKIKIIIFKTLARVRKNLIFRFIPASL